MAGGMKRAASGLLALAAVFAAPAARGEETSLALPATSLTFTAAYVATDKGFWQDQGLVVKQVLIQGVGAPNAVIAGSVDFTVTTASTFGRAAARGQRMLVIANLLDKPMMELVLRKDFADEKHFDAQAPLAERAKVLKGATIGVDGIYTNLHAYTQLVAIRAGLDPESDIRVTPMPAPNMPAALKTKAIDGFASSLPWTIDAVQSGAAVMLASSPRGDLPELLPFNYSVVMTRPSLCAEHRSVCEKMAHGFAHANQFIKDHPQETVALVKSRFSTMSDAILAASIETIRGATSVPPVPTLKGFEDSEQFNVNSRMMKPEEALKSFDGLYTTEFVK
jgi:NitT/TauT family transport system substrate-binding protein